MTITIRFADTNRATFVVKAVVQIFSLIYVLLTKRAFVRATSAANL